MGKFSDQNKQVGHYLGTEIDGKWWKRYHKNKFLARGNGEYSVRENSFCFLRYMTKSPLEICFEDIVDVKIGKWHAGKWYAGWSIVKIFWMREGMRLSSGFAVSKSQDFVLKFVEELKQRTDRSQKPPSDIPANQIDATDFQSSR